MDETELKLIHEKLGSNIISILKSNSEAKKSVKKLESLAKKFDNKDSRTIVLEKGYAGFVLASLCKENPVAYLNEYNRILEERVLKNPYAANCPDFIKSVYNDVFQSSA
jgi:hypothetical protein